MGPEQLLHLALALGAPIGVYAAIRADLREALVKSGKAQQDAEKAHDRLDSHIEKHHTKG